MRCLVKSSWDENVLVIEEVSHLDDRFIAIVPKDENGEYVDDINSLSVIDEPQYSMQPRVSVDGNGDPITEEFQGIDSNGDSVVMHRYVYEKDGNGDLILDQVQIGTMKVAQINQTKWDQFKVHREMVEEERKANAEFTGIESFRSDIENQTKALIAKQEGDSTRFTTVSKALRYADYADYLQEGLVSGKKYCCIVETAGVLSIVSADWGTKPSNFKRIAPRGFKPGDEEFLTLNPDGSITIDWDGRMLKFETLEKSADVAREKDEWNAQSPLERLKNAIYSGD